jgi:hypothetical protein
MGLFSDERSMIHHDLCKYSNSCLAGRGAEKPGDYDATLQSLRLLK